MPTIKDVAKKAGVSISTASYALNNVPSVHPETKQRILDAAKELNYYPNGIARNLKTKKTGNVGVFVYGFSGPIFSNVLEGIRQTLQEYGFNIIVSSGKSSENLLNERQVDGAIIFDNNLTDECLKNYAAHDFPIILLDRNLEGKNIYTSVIDNENIVYQFIMKMIQKGYKDFGFLSGPLDAFNNNRRFDGFQKALNDGHIEKHVYYQGDFTTESGYKIGKEIIKNKHIPRFIYCANDESAIGLMKALKEVNIRIPEDVALAGFDNIYLGEYLTPKLTTIGIDHVEWGRNVAQAISELIKNKTIESFDHPDGQIIMRESC
ncbi:MAG: LacI family DNA-binding transcriptional regulator [Acholeplasmataceae bacterium]